jgi:hypothetical protein
MVEQFPRGLQFRARLPFSKLRMNRRTARLQLLKQPVNIWFRALLPQRIPHNVVLIRHYTHFDDDETRQSTRYVFLSKMCSAVRSANAHNVRVGFAVPTVGNVPLPTKYRFA